MIRSFGFSATFFFFFADTATDFPGRVHEVVMDHEDQFNPLSDVIRFSARGYAAKGEENEPSGINSDTLLDEIWNSMFFANTTLSWIGGPDIRGSSSAWRSRCLAASGTGCARLCGTCIVGRRTRITHTLAASGTCRSGLRLRWQFWSGITTVTSR